jgi:hypothetical protein
MAASGQMAAQWSQAKEQTPVNAVLPCSKEKACDGQIAMQRPQPLHLFWSITTLGPFFTLYFPGFLLNRFSTAWLLTVSEKSVEENAVEMLDAAILLKYDQARIFLIFCDNCFN